MKRLSDVLNTRELCDLIKIASEQNIVFPDFNTEEEWKAIKRLSAGPDSERIGYYLELSYEEDDDDNYSLTDNLEEFDPETQKTIIAFREQEKNLMNSIRRAEDFKFVLSEKIAVRLLDKNVFEKYLIGAADVTIDLLEHLAVMEMSSVKHDSKYDLELPWEQNKSADALETAGYAVVYSTKAWENSDEHKHITGITVTSDVLKLFCDTYTSDFSMKRSNYNAIKKCCCLAVSYYEVALLETVMEIYHRLCESNGVYLKMDERDFAEIAREQSSDFYEIVEFQGKCYVTIIGASIGLEDIDNPGDTLIEFRVQNLEEREFPPYIPEAEEIREYTENGFWPSRESYSRLKEWLTLFYMDEKEIENIGPGFMGMFLSMGAEDDEYFRQRYSMDDVEENVLEKMQYITWLCMLDYTADEIMQDDEIEVLTIPVTEQAKEEFRNIISECIKNTNKPNLIGYCDSNWPIDS